MDLAIEFELEFEAGFEAAAERCLRLLNTVWPEANRTAASLATDSFDSAADTVRMKRGRCCSGNFGVADRPNFGTASAAHGLSD